MFKLISVPQITSRRPFQGLTSRPACATIRHPSSSPRNPLMYFMHCPSSSSQAPFISLHLRSGFPSRSLMYATAHASPSHYPDISRCPLNFLRTSDHCCPPIYPPNPSRSHQTVAHSCIFSNPWLSMAMNMALATANLLAGYYEICRFQLYSF